MPPLKKQLQAFLSAATKRPLAKKITGSFGLKIAVVGFSFFTSVFLARALSAEGYGLYAYAVTWVSVLQIPATLGLRELVLREVSSEVAGGQASEDKTGHLSGILRWANGLVLGVSVVLAAIAACFILTQQWGTNRPLAITFWIALISLPMLSLTALRQGTMQGFGRVVISQVPEKLIQPLSFLLFLLTFYWTGTQDLNAQWVILLRVSSIVLAFVVGNVFLAKTIPAAVKGAIPTYSIRRWIKSCLPFVLISSTFVINRKTDILMLGALQGTASVGIYTVVNRGSDFIPFILVAVNASIGPSIARLYRQGNLAGLQSLITKSTRLIFWYSLAVMLLLTVFGQWFLLIFGRTFVTGYTTLLILNLGKLFNAASGSVGLLLNMTGNERASAFAVGVSAVMNIVLNALLIPRYGTEGAAIATSSSFILWNGISLYVARKRLGINPTIFTGF